MYLMLVRGIEIPASEMRKNQKLWFQNCVRINLGLDDKDYQLLQGIEKNIDRGWCFLSKQELAKMIGLTRSNVVIHLNKLISKGLVVRNFKVKQALALTDFWTQTKEKYKDAK